MLIKTITSQRVPRQVPWQVSMMTKTKRDLSDSLCRQRMFGNQVINQLVNECQMVNFQVLLFRRLTDSVFSQSIQELINT